MQDAETPPPPKTNDAAPARPLKIAIAAGEVSGDILGAAMLSSLRAMHEGEVIAEGIGGDRLLAKGLKLWFHHEHLAHVGLAAVLQHLPALLARLRQAEKQTIEFSPDLLVIIDSPDFTHRLAKRVRKKLPAMKIVNYAPPSVWAWRPSRARAMLGYVDLCLGLFPFEKQAYERLGGPPLVTTGHPMIEQLPEVYHPKQAPLTRPIHPSQPNIILLMPGSRRKVVQSTMPTIIELLHRLRPALGEEIVLKLPTVPARLNELKAYLPELPYPCELIVDEAEKEAAIRGARLGLYSFGTAVLEGALRQLPMLCLFRPGWLEDNLLRPLIKLEFFALPNIILGREAVRESTHKSDNLDDLAEHVLDLWQEGPRREAMIKDFRELSEAMHEGGEAPGARAARAVLALLKPKAGANFPR